MKKIILLAFFICQSSSIEWQSKHTKSLMKIGSIGLLTFFVFNIVKTAKTKEKNSFLHTFFDNLFFTTHFTDSIKVSRYTQYQDRLIKIFQEFRIWPDADANVAIKNYLKNILSDNEYKQEIDLKTLFRNASQEDKNLVLNIYKEKLKNNNYDDIKKFNYINISPLASQWITSDEQKLLIKENKQISIKEFADLFALDYKTLYDAEQFKQLCRVLLLHDNKPSLIKYYKIYDKIWSEYSEQEQKEIGSVLFNKENLENFFYIHSKTFDLIRVACNSDFAICKRTGIDDDNIIPQMFYTIAYNLIPYLDDEEIKLLLDNQKIQNKSARNTKISILEAFMKQMDYDIKNLDLYSHKPSKATFERLKKLFPHSL